MPHILFLTVSLLFLLTSCSLFAPVKLQQPKVALASIEVLPSDPLKPKLKIGLNIFNPNKISLDFEGLSYTIAIEGIDMVAGVSNNLPSIPGFSEKTVYISATIDLRRSLSLLSLLWKEKRKTVTYAFKAELAPKGILPKIRLSETGQLSL